MICLYLLSIYILKYGINYGQEPEDNTDVILISGGYKINTFWKYVVIVVLLRP